MDSHTKSTATVKWAGFKWWVLIGVFLTLVSCEPDAPDAPKTAVAPTEAIAYEGTIVAVGDSLTAGLGVPEASAYPALLARKLFAGGYRYRVINAGVSGETSSGALARMQWVLSSLKPDIVILETGANDGLRGIDPALLSSNLDRICTLLREQHVEIVLAGMQMLPNLGPEYVEAFATIYPRIAEKHPVIFMPFFLKDVAGDKRLNQPDRIHPTAEGYRRITENIYPYVIEAINIHRSKTSASGPKIN